MNEINMLNRPFYDKCVIVTSHNLSPTPFENLYIQLIYYAMWSKCNNNKNLVQGINQ